MFLIEIGDRIYNLPQDWSEVRLDKYLKIEEHRDTLSENLSKILSGEKIDHTPEDIKWVKEFVQIVVEIPESILSQVKILSEEEISITGIFNAISWLLTIPTESAAVDRFTHNNKVYVLTQSKKDINGATIPFGESTFEEFEEASDINKLIREQKNFKHLALLLAILYRPVKRKWFKEIKTPYSGKEAIERAKEFSDLPCDIAFKALFFFINLKLISLKDSLTSSKEAIREADDLISTGGIQSSVPLQKKASLIQRGKLLSEVWKWRTYTKCLRILTARKSKQKSMNLSGKKK